MIDSVKRFNFFAYHDPMIPGGVSIKSVSDLEGNFVYYSDYKALLDRLNHGVKIDDNAFLDLIKRVEALERLVGK